MTTSGKPKHKSRTLRTAAVVALLGAVVENFPLLRDLLGEHYGIAFVAISGVFAYLRTITEEPLR